MLKNKYLKIFVSILLMSLTMFTMTACSNAETTSEATYEQITAEQAKKLMDTETDYIILDTRTEKEFAEAHILNSILISHYEIVDRAEKEFPDKDQLIFVYCRSGNRSKQASQTLAELGYTNVIEFGGIIDWEYGVIQ